MLIKRSFISPLLLYRCVLHNRVTPILCMSTYYPIRDLDCSRRDDLESLAYTLIYFLKGTLPWRKVKPPPDADKHPKLAWDKILAAKLAAEASGSITSGLPTEFDIFYRYVRGLAFEDLPDYEGCRRLFRDLARREGIEYDGIFDWSVVGERVWRRRSMKREAAAAAVGKHGKGSSSVPPGGVAVAGHQTGRRRFCEACEARAQLEARQSQSTPPPSVTRQPRQRMASA